MVQIIRDLIYAEQFHPFVIHHKKGQGYRVANREAAWVSPIGVWVVVGDRMHILNPAMIEKIETSEDAVIDN